MVMHRESPPPGVAQHLHLVLQGWEGSKGQRVHCIVVMYPVPHPQQRQDALVPNRLDYCCVLLIIPPPLHLHHAAVLDTRSS